MESIGIGDGYILLVDKSKKGEEVPKVVYGPIEEPNFNINFNTDMFIKNNKAGSVRNNSLCGEASPKSLYSRNNEEVYDQAFPKPQF